MRLIGLTGGIATGKSTVSRYLADTYQLPVLDADVYAQEAVQIGSPILADIVQHYGQKILLADGSLNRVKLGDIIFNDLKEKDWLEKKIHPYVRECFQTKLSQINAQTVILVIPLLFEANLTHLVTEIWVIYCSFDEQIKRLMQRNNLSESQAIARIQSQFPLEKKAAMADVVLDNSSTRENLINQIQVALNTQSN